MRTPVVGVLLDGVIATYDKNRGVMEISRPTDGAPAFCKWLQEDVKATVVILTGRRREDIVAKYLSDNKIPYSTVNITPDDTSLADRTKNWVICDYYILPVSRGGIFAGSFAEIWKKVSTDVNALRERFKRTESKDW